MARGKGRGRKGKQAENLSKFAGPDGDKETIEKLAEAAKKVNEKGGHNSDPPDEVLDRNFNAIELAWTEIDAAGRIMQKARSALSAALKTAKADCGSKAWAASIEKAVKEKRKADKGGAAEMASEHRQIGRILRLKGVPLGTQFKLYAFDDADAAAAGGIVAAMDAELQGQAAYRNSEPPENNPFQQGTQEHQDWSVGYHNAEAATAHSMGNGTEAAAH